MLKVLPSPGLLCPGWRGWLWSLGRWTTLVRAVSRVEGTAPVAHSGHQEPAMPALRPAVVDGLFYPAAAPALGTQRRTLMSIPLSISTLEKALLQLLGHTAPQPMAIDCGSPFSFSTTSARVLN